MLKAAPLLLTYHSLNQKGRRKQLGFTFLFFLSKYTNVNFLKDVWHSGVQSCYVQSQLDQKVAGCPLLKWSEKRKPRASLKCEWVQRPLSHVYLHWGHAEPTRELRKCKPLLLHFSIFTFKTRAALSFNFLLLLLYSAKDFPFSFVAKPSHGHVYVFKIFFWLPVLQCLAEEYYHPCLHGLESVSKENRHQVIHSFTHSFSYSFNKSVSMMWLSVWQTLVNSSHGRHF